VFQSHRCRGEWFHFRKEIAQELCEAFGLSDEIVALARKGEPGFTVIIYQMTHEFPPRVGQLSVPAGIDFDDDAAVDAHGIVNVPGHGLVKNQDTTAAMIRAINRAVILQEMTIDR
jgi:hypothetical protein